ncbi:hypothetical protein [Dactylosporangium salmoneum]|uniref:DUF5666 domain-containing protein n=1 Tax=Dactylosporangium salmoneum TaxID=53361 RepID=A0ABN3FUQ1_9ACTN
MTKHRLLAALAAGALCLGVAGCAAGPADDLQTVSVDTADDGAVPAALAALGLGDASASPAPGKADKAGKDGLRHRIRVRLRKHMLHGEATVQTRSGPQTVVVQRGIVTAKNGTTLTVRSTDGFTQTWATDAGTKVVAAGKAASLDAVATGADVALGGVKSDPQSARLVVVPKR